MRHPSEAEWENRDKRIQEAKDALEKLTQEKVSTVEADDSEERFLDALRKMEAEKLAQRVTAEAAESKHRRQRKEKAAREAEMLAVLEAADKAEEAAEAAASESGAAADPSAQPTLAGKLGALLHKGVRKVWKKLPRRWRYQYLKVESRTVAAVDEAREKAARRRKVAARLNRRNRLRFHHLLAEIWDGIAAFCEAQKKFLLLGLGGAAVIAIAAGTIIGSLSYYEYSYQGKVLGLVKSQNDVYTTIELIGDKLSTAHNSQVYLDPDEDITFRRVWKQGRTADTPDQVLDALSYLQDMKTDAYAIVADGKTLAVVETEEAAQSILDSLTNSFKEDGKNYSQVGFAQEVEIKKISTNIGSLQRKVDAEDYIRTGGTAQKIYTVVAGDTFSAIAKRMGMTQKELRAMNPDIEINKLKIGQEIILSQVSALLTVETVSTETYVEEVAYDIVYQETSALYQGESRVKSKGTNGERQVTAKVTRQNGMVVAAEELESTTLKESISQIVLKGTKPVPARIGTGTYIYPTRGTITSRFGTRWGRMHYGVDIANNTGTAIVASDGGKVTSAGWENSYGYVIRINHGANVTTVYAHCSKLLVSVGEKVYQGQKIAEMGSTGNSTGPHLHFEVRINGVAKNPLNYLP
ncbi:MAG: LysM peptidoglycan-binding domain-containing protein [Clostridiales bacterium]|nr:LysM peptidoglycan-binding domain-containing protein [Clostridiales bacterium]